MKNENSDRRRFLAQSAGLAGAGWLALNTPMLLAAGTAAGEQRAAGGAWANFSPEEGRLFAAVADQIVPPDDTPGAAAIGVAWFIDQALGGFMAGEAGMLKAGLADLDRSAREAYGAGFADLAFEQQTGLLRTIDTTPFFGRMIFLTHCGMFALPAWGGNRDGAGWALLGFDSRHAWQPPFGHYDIGHHGAGPHEAAPAAEDGGHGRG